MIGLSEELFNKYSFLRICEYYKLLSRIYYNQSLIKLGKNYQLFIKDENCNEDYKIRLNQSMELSKYILFQLDVQPNNIGLTGRASIQLEYEINSSYFEIEIYSDKIISIILPNRSNYQNFYKLELTIFEISKLFVLLENFFYKKDNKIYLEIQKGG